MDRQGIEAISNLQIFRRSALPGGATKGEHLDMDFIMQALVDPKIDTCGSRQTGSNWTFIALGQVRQESHAVIDGGNA